MEYLATATENAVNSSSNSLSVIFNCYKFIIILKLY